MIRYDLKCGVGHTFDSWFQSAAAFDKLSAAGMIACAICGDSHVEKALMSPRVTTSDRTAPRSPDQPAAPQADTAAAPAPAPTADETAAALRAVRETVEKNATYVGEDFATEARAQHDGDAPERPIYGEAKIDEARKLVKDGVPVAPLPFIPTRKTN